MALLFFDILRLHLHTSLDMSEDLLTSRITKFCSFLTHLLCPHFLSIKIEKQNMYFPIIKQEISFFYSNYYYTLIFFTSVLIVSTARRTLEFYRNTNSLCLLIQRTNSLLLDLNLLIVFTHSICKKKVLLSNQLVYSHFH